MEKALFFLLEETQGVTLELKYQCKLKALINRQTKKQVWTVNVCAYSHTFSSFVH